MRSTTSAKRLLPKRCSILQPFSCFFRVLPILPLHIVFFFCAGAVSAVDEDRHVRGSGGDRLGGSERRDRIRDRRSRHLFDFESSRNFSGAVRKKRGPFVYVIQSQDLASWLATQPKLNSRSKSGYILFSAEIRKRIMLENPSCTFGEISKMVGVEVHS